MNYVEFDAWYSGASMSQDSFSHHNVLQCPDDNHNSMLNVLNFMQKDLTKVKIFQKVLGA